MGIDRRTVLTIAADADVDVRSAEKEIRRANGEAVLPVRGRAGERLRAAMQRHGIPPAPLPERDGGRAA